MDIFLRPEVSKVPNRGTQHAKAGVVEKIADLIFEFECELDDSTLLLSFSFKSWPVDAALASKSKFESVQSTEEDKVDSAEELIPVGPVTEARRADPLPSPSPSWGSETRALEGMKQGRFPD